LLLQQGAELGISQSDAERTVLEPLALNGFENTLPTPDRAKLRLHCVICGICRNVGEPMAGMRKALNAMGQDQDAGPPKT